MTEQPLATATDLTAYRSADPAMLVAAAEAAVRSHCGWHIAPERTETLTLDSDGTTVLLLPTMRVTSVTEVRDVTSDTPEVLTEWRNKPTPRFTAGVLERANGWPCGAVEVDLVHGYTAAPADVQAVLLDLAEMLKNSRGGATRQAAGPFQVQIAQQAMTELHKMVLDRYRIPTVP